VFGESILNDAVSIVLFRTFLQEYARNEVYTVYTLPSTLLNFVTISLGSLTVGALIGLSCSFIYKHSRIRDYPKFEISLLFLFAYGSYAFAEAISLSVRGHREECHHREERHLQAARRCLLLLW
jgi:NhaP-type Na+/H+ or K+/H+ antiporter